MYSKSPITPDHNKPIEIYQVRADIAARDLIPANVRYIGRECITEDTGNKYRLVGGITNADWVMVSSGNGELTRAKESFTITQTDLNNGWLDLSNPPHSVDTLDLYLDGVLEPTASMWTLATARITFTNINDLYLGATVDTIYYY